MTDHGLILDYLPIDFPGHVLLVRQHISTYEELLEYLSKHDNDIMQLDAISEEIADRIYTALSDEGYIKKERVEPSESNILDDRLINHDSNRSTETNTSFERSNKEYTDKSGVKHMIKSRFSVIEDTNGNQTVEYIEFDDNGKLTSKEEATLTELSDNGSVHSWFESYAGEQQESAEATA